MRRSTTFLLTALLVTFGAEAGWCGKTMPAPSTLVAPLPPVSNNFMMMAADTGRISLDLSEQPSSAKRVSTKKAMLLSMLLPGAGQYYAGSTFKGQVFMGIEAAIWSGFIAYRVYGDWKREDYEAYAATHAGVDNDGKDEEFYDWVGFYTSREEFNQLGRLYYPERPFLPDDAAHDWQWDSESSREVFKNLKDASKKSFRNASFMLGLALFNRVIAGIDTYRTVKAAGKKVESMTQFGEYKMRVSPRLFGHNQGLTISFSRKF
ncbi:MAG: hypothetical protein GYA46_06895 [candidate division Zixibacteria bacterium]|nr:hypothetical protein [candidate division Zixibacteria bacterium]